MSCSLVLFSFISTNYKLLFTKNISAKETNIYSQNDSAVTQLNRISDVAKNRCFTHKAEYFSTGSKCKKDF